MVFRNCVFDAGTFTINPGILSATFDHCTITARSSAVVQCTFDGMLIQEPSRVTFTDCTLSSSASTKAPQAFGGKNAQGLVAHDAPARRRSQRKEGGVA
jgi:hypothetical protein